MLKSFTPDDAQNVQKHFKIPTFFFYLFFYLFYGYLAVLRQPRIQTRQLVDNYCINKSELRQGRNE